MLSGFLWDWCSSWKPSDWRDYDEKWCKPTAWTTVLLWFALGLCDEAKLCDSSRRMLWTLLWSRQYLFYACPLFFGRQALQVKVKPSSRTKRRTKQTEGSEGLTAPVVSYSSLSLVKRAPNPNGSPHVPGTAPSSRPAARPGPLGLVDLAGWSLPFTTRIEFPTCSLSPPKKGINKE